MKNFVLGLLRLKGKLLYKGHNFDFYYKFNALKSNGWAMLLFGPSQWHNFWSKNINEGVNISWPKFAVKKKTV